MIGDAVDAGGAEVTLEGGDHFHGRPVIFAGHRHAVAVSGQRPLQALDALADVAEFEALAAHDRRRLHPVPDAGIGQRMPRKLLAGVLLARRGDVGMAEHAMRRHLAAEHDAAAQRDHGGDLAQRKFRIAPVVAAIDDLDADRTGVDVLFAAPGRHAGMPGALGLRHALHDAAVLQHDVMRGDVGARGAELRDRALHVRHAGVVQHDHVGQAALAAVAVIRRRDDVGDDR